MDEDAEERSGSGRLTRRQAIGAGAGAVGLLAVGGYGATRVAGDDAKADFVVRAEPGTVELGTRRARTWTYDGALPGREIRLRQGRRVRIRVENDLPDPTTVHWHGIRLDNGADGVPGFTQDPIGPGDSFLYEFTPPDAGTYFFHSHVGVQLDRGLYAPLIVEPVREELDYDREAVLMLDDWLDGVAGTPDRQLEQLKGGGMDMGGSGSAGGGPATGRHTTLDGRTPTLDDLASLANLMERGQVDPGDVRHPIYLVNGRPPEDPFSVSVKRGERLRLRLVNAASDTHFCLFVDGRPITITHADGLRVEDVETDAVLIGMGERYDVMVEGGAGVRRVFAMPLGKRGRAVGLLRSPDARGGAPVASAPFEVPRRLASYSDLRDRERPDSAPQARETRVDLGFKAPYVWTLGGQAFSEADVIQARRGEVQRFVMANRTDMPHPMHLHGHSFRAGPGGALKDTVVVAPRREVTVEWTADNPGTWAFHCHNAYHQEAGMLRKVEVA